MSEQQKRHTLKASSVLVEFSDEMDDWTSEEREFVVKQGVRSYQLLRVAVQAELARNKQAQSLLREIGTKHIPELGEFVAKKKFRKGKTTDGVKISSLCVTFQNNLLGKKEQATGKVTLKKRELLHNSRDKKNADGSPGIITNVGGEKQAEIKLSQFFEFLKTVDKNLRYIAYIRDYNGVLLAVSAEWRSDGWQLYAASVSDPALWGSGRVIVSR